MKWLAFFGSFDGRIGRKTFWLTSLAVAGAGIVVAFLAVLVAFLLSATPRAAGTVLDLVSYVILYPQLVITVKRGHDRNIATSVISTCYALIVGREVLVSLGWLVAFPDQHSATTKGVASFLAAMVVAIIGIALLIELGFRRGTRGPNQFGPDPLVKAELTELHPAT